MDLIAETPRFPKAGETVLGTSFTTSPGGKGANQAVQAARLGADVTMVGKVGRDALGTEILQAISHSGVHTGRILRTDEASSGVAQIQIEKNGNEVQNLILVIPGANMRIAPEDVAFLKDEMASFDMLMMQLEIPVAINRILTEYARDAGVPVMLNPAPYVPLTGEDYAGVSYVSPNESEAEAMTGRPAGTLEKAAEALVQMREMGVLNPMITMGGKGAACLSGGELIFEKAIPNLPVKDPTAAGDSFVSAFCTAVAAGCGVRHAMIFAKHTAGITVCNMGAQPSLPQAAAVFASMEAAGDMSAQMRRLKEALLG